MPVAGDKQHTPLPQRSVGKSLYRRSHDLNESDLELAARAWEATRPVELTSAVEIHAGQSARDHALRSAEPFTSLAPSP
jgi:hypothetical protein